MAFPFGHLADGFGWVPATLVGAIRRDGVIHIAHCAHARIQADLLTGETVRITAAIDFFVVVQAHIQHQRADLLAGNQHARTGFRMIAHGGEFIVSELTGFVQHLIGDRHLADVMQQPGQPSLTHLGLVEPQVASQSNHQRADRHRMHVGVFVGVFQPRQADQRIGMTHDRIGNFLNQLPGLFKLQGLAHARVTKHANHSSFGTLAELGRTPYLILHRHRQVDRRALYRSQEGGLGFSGDLFGADTDGADLDIQPLADINPQLTDAAGLDPLQVFFRVEKKLGFPEGVVHPCATELVDIHTDSHVGHSDALQHGWHSNRKITRLLSDKNR